MEANGGAPSARGPWELEDEGAREPAARQVLALDIGGTKVAWGLVRVRARRLSASQRGSVPTSAWEGGPEVARRVTELARRLVADNPGIDGIGVASAGVVDPASGAIVSATGTMPGWAGTPLGAALAEATGRPVAVLNDVHAHGLGEAVLGAGRGFGTVLSFAVGTGLGGALVHHGSVFQGDHHIAGHFGHVHHHFAPDMECSCGRSGHIEAFCSGSGIVRWYNSLRGGAEPQARDGRGLQELADGGNALAATCFERSGYALGEAIASLSNCVDPGAVVLSGSMTKSGPRWWKALRLGYAAGAMTPLAGVPLLPGALGGDAPLLGAALELLSREH